MSLSAATAFNLGASSSMSPQAAMDYDVYMKSYYEKFNNTSGWFTESINKVKEEHRYFMDSHMWEFSNIIKNKEGHFVGKYEIGYLSEVEYQRDAIGYMRDIIMANPNMMQLYIDGRASGYENDFSTDLNSGIGRDNYYYNKIMNGYVNDNNEGRIHRTQYNTNRDGRTNYTVKERRDSHRTWRATDIHIDNGLDPTSILGNGLLSIEEGLKALEARNNIN